MHCPIWSGLWWVPACLSGYVWCGVLRSDASRGGAWLCLALTFNAIFDLLLFGTSTQEYDFNVHPSIAQLAGLQFSYTEVYENSRCVFSNKSVDNSAVHDWATLLLVGRSMHTRVFPACDLATIL